MEVLAHSKGYPYLAGIIYKIENDKVLVQFPFQTNCEQFEYDTKNVIPYRTQFQGKKFTPIKAVPKLRRKYVKTQILLYELNLIKNRN